MFDSHCHLTDSRFADDLDDVLARAWAAGLTGIVTIASDASDADVAWTLAGGTPHPVHRRRAPPRRRSRHGRGPGSASATLLACRTSWPSARPASTTTTTTRHGTCSAPLRVAPGPRRRDRPAGRRPFPLRRRRPGRHDPGRPASRGVLHCFSGGAALLDTALDAGWFVSFAGMVTFRNFDGAGPAPRRARDRLLVETDSPTSRPCPTAAGATNPFSWWRPARRGRVCGARTRRDSGTTRNARALLRPGRAGGGP
jgi:TatD DNase family protein